MSAQNEFPSPTRYSVYHVPILLPCSRLWTLSRARKEYLPWAVPAPSLLEANGYSSQLLAATYQGVSRAGINYSVSLHDYDDNCKAGPASKELQRIQPTP